MSDQHKPPYFPAAANGSAILFLHPGGKWGRNMIGIVSEWSFAAARRRALEYSSVLPEGFSPGVVDGFGFHRVADGV